MIVSDWMVAFATIRAQEPPQVTSIKPNDNLICSTHTVIKRPHSFVPMLKTLLTTSSLQ